MVELAAMMIGRGRPANTYGRSQGAKTPAEKTLIVCEGETEVIYLAQIKRSLGRKLSNVEIKESTEGPNPSAVVASAERMARARDLGNGDHVFCVFDGDNPVDFALANQRIQTLNAGGAGLLQYHAATSIPCWEFWALLHYERTTRQENSCAPIAAKLKTKLPSYRKAHEQSAQALIGHLPHALAAADWLEQQGQGPADNPSTTVHRLIRHLYAIAQQN